MSMNVLWELTTAIKTPSAKTPTVHSRVLANLVILETELHAKILTSVRREKTTVIKTPSAKTLMVDSHAHANQGILEMV